MAITGNASYVSTTQEFIAHWELVNASLPPTTPLTLAGGVGVGDLAADLETLVTIRSDLEAAMNAVELGRADIRWQKEALVALVVAFNAYVRGIFADTKWVEALPEAPRESDLRGKFLTPCDDVKNLWARLENDGHAFTIAGGVDLIAFDAAISTLSTAYAQHQNDTQAAKLKRVERNQQQEKIYPLLKQYRQVVPAVLAPGAPLIETLPRLTPQPGATPEPVNASALWDSDAAKAKIVWEASANAKLKEYQVRYTPGPHYDADDEAVVATILPEDPRELLTDAGLTQPGARSSFKVYVILTTGNEAGSEAMTVERPAA